MCQYVLQEAVTFFFARQAASGLWYLYRAGVAHPLGMRGVSEAPLPGSHAAEREEGRGSGRAATAGWALDREGEDWSDSDVGGESGGYADEGQEGGVRGEGGWGGVRESWNAPQMTCEWLGVASDLLGERLWEQVHEKGQEAVCAVLQSVRELSRGLSGGKGQAGEGRRGEELEERGRVEPPLQVLLNKLLCC